MAKGLRNYFRHYFNARNDEMIVALMDQFGLQGYFYFFSLIEICSEKVQDCPHESVTLHAATLRKELRLTTRKLNLLLTFLEQESKIGWTLVGHSYQIKISNLPKYLGKYDFKNSKKGPIKRKENKIKQNKIKENKIKESESVSSFHDAKNFLENWNRLNLKQVALNPESLRRIDQGINSRLNQNLGTQKIADAIQNYANVINHKSSWYTHRFSIFDFLNRESADRFYSDFCLEDYIKQEKTIKTMAEIRQNKLKEMNFENSFQD